MLRIRAQPPGLTTKNPKTNKFWNFVDNGETAELQLFGTIESEESWWNEDCVTYRNFIEELNGLGKKETINVAIHSAGGDVFAANAIYTALSTNAANITGTILGICASAATIILMACDNRRIAKNAILMAHNPSVSLWGSYQADELVKLAEVANTVKKSIVAAYMERLDKSEEEISQLMDDESWYVGQEAVDAGFCDEVIEADFQNSACMNQFMVDGVSYSFQNYLETFVPRNIQKKVRALSKTPQKEARAFLNTQNVKKGHEKMDEETNVTKLDIKDAAGLKGAYPDLCTQIAAQAVEAERARLKAIDEIAAGIPKDVLEKAKYTEPVTAADLALAQMKANNRLGKKFMDDLESDFGDSGAAAVGGEPNEGYDPKGEKAARDTQKVGRLAAKLKKDKRRENNENV